jgi:D-3-phosphoglycerate dehydrogenase
MTVAIVDALELLEPAVELLRAEGIAVEVFPPGLSQAAAAERAAQNPVAIIGLLPFRAEHIARLKDTRLLIRAGIGYDIIDVDAATEAGILVANVPDYCVDEVADHTLTLLLAAWRRLVAMTGFVPEHGWAVNDFLPPVHRIRGSRLGVVGFGRIGRAVAARAAAFGWEVSACDTRVDVEQASSGTVTPQSLEDLFRWSHAVTLHVPLTPETRHLVNASLLSVTGDGLVLVNTSRGGVVDLAALYEAISNGKVSAAALDVLDGEPTPDLKQPLLQHPHVIVTPHVAWYSIEARRELAVKAAQEAIRFLRGEPVQNAVNGAAVASRLSTP